MFFTGQTQQTRCCCGSSSNSHVAVPAGKNSPPFPHTLQLSILVLAIFAIMIIMMIGIMLIMLILINMIMIMIILICCCSRFYYYCLNHFYNQPSTPIIVTRKRCAFPYPRPPTLKLPTDLLSYTVTWTRGSSSRSNSHTLSLSASPWSRNLAPESHKSTQELDYQRHRGPSQGRRR